MGRYWVPSSEEHKETIYYITGYVLRAIHRIGAGKRKDISSTYCIVKLNAYIVMSEASTAELFLGRVQCAEDVTLYYSKRPFYKRMCSVESMFDSL